MVKKRSKLWTGRQRLPKSDARWLLLLALASAALLLWVPWLWLPAFPFRMLSTLVHELAHGLASIVTGGDFLRFVVYPDGSGLALTAGGWRLVVVPAGYLGLAVFAAGLVLVGGRPRTARRVLAVLGVLVALLSLRFGTPSILAGEIGAGVLAILAGTVWGAALLWVALAAGDRWVSYAVLLLASVAGITAGSDLLTLVGLSGLAEGPATDARSMAELTLIPALVWALVWAATAVVLMVYAVRRAW